MKSIMLAKCVFSVFIVTLAIHSVRLDDTMLENEIMDSNVQSDQMKYTNQRDVNNTPTYMPLENNYPAEPPKESWLDSARTALSGPAGQIVVHMAKEMISRSTGNSQILSLNLTNLLILVLLKALILAAGLIGAGNWGQYARARSIDGSPFLKPEEGQLFIGYLALEGSGHDGCLNQAACKAPEMAKEYLKAAMAVIKGTEMLDMNVFNNTKYYSYTLNQMEHSIQRGMDGEHCDLIYHCHL